MERTRPPEHPGAILQRQYLEPLLMSVERLSEVTHIPQTRLEQFVQGTISLDVWMAYEFAIYFETTVQLWLNLQIRYDNFYKGNEHGYQFYG